MSFTHLYSSHLQRAAKTAGLIRHAQLASTADGSQRDIPDVVQLPVLMEQDFGFYEGKKFFERPADGKLSGKDNHRQTHKDIKGFVDVESKDSLARRADRFLDDHLLPLLDSPTEETDLAIAVVSHGIMLSSLWKRILSRLPEKSVKLAPELAASGPVTLEHLGGWSNTGFLELLMSRAYPEPTVPAPAAVKEETVPKVSPPPVDAPSLSEPHYSPTKVAVAPSNDSTVGSAQSPKLSAKSSPRKLGSEWSTVILTINGKDHLRNLKRTGGGVGSSRHDASQKNIHSFFKRRKVD